MRRVQRLQLENLRARDQRAVDGEERVLGGRPQQADHAALDIGQQRVLLRAIEAMDFIDEQDGPRRGFVLQAVCRRGDDAPDVCDRALDAAQTLETRPRRSRDDLG